MAELVGVIASGIGIAQLAKGIIITSFKVKGLLEEIKEVPEELQGHLNQIQLLAPLLADINDDGPPALTNAVQTAAAQCQQAAEELRKLAEDLHAQIGSGSRTRRKIRTAKVVLQKDVLARHEKRLSSAMQMLNLAFQMYSHSRQNYLIDLQKAQPNVIVSQILVGLSKGEGSQQATGQGDSSHEPTNQITSVVSTQRLRQPSQKTISNTLSGWQNMTFDFRTSTGALELYLPQEDASDEDPLEDHLAFGIRLRLPSWLSSRGIDSMLLRGQAGWKHHFRAIKVHAAGSETEELVTNTLRNPDSLSTLRNLLAKRQIGIHDEFRDRENEESYTLLDIAVQNRNWQTASFLVDYELSFSTTFLFDHVWDDNHTSSPKILNILKRYQENHALQIFIWSGYTGNVTTFNAKRRSIWPDWEFYDNSLTSLRIIIASYMLNFSMFLGGTNGPAVAATLLSPRGLELGDSTKTVFTSGKDDAYLLFYNIFCQEIFRRRDSFHDAWYTFHETVLNRLVAEIVSAYSAHKHSLYLNLFELSPLRIPAQFRGSTSSQHRKTYISTSQGRSEMLNNRLKQYVDVISASGVDLEDYGHYFQNMVKVEPVLRKFLYTRSDAKIEFRVVALEYGPRPDDWNVWFGDMADEYVGDFWQLVDPESSNVSVRMPGAWVEEEEEDWFREQHRLVRDYSDTTRSF